MTRHAFITLLIIAISFCTPLWGSWIGLTGEPTPISAWENRTLIAGDKLFFDFDVFSFKIGDVIESDEEILVQGGVDEETGFYGIKFFINEDVSTNQLVSINLSYQAAVSAENEKALMTGVLMKMDGIEASGSGLVSASGTVFDNTIPTSQIIASLELALQDNDITENIQDFELFSGEPDRSISVSHGISITGNSIPQSRAALSGLEVLIVQVPEPTMLLLLGLGSVVLIQRRR